MDITARTHQSCFAWNIRNSRQRTAVRLSDPKRIFTIAAKMLWKAAKHGHTKGKSIINDVNWQFLPHKQQQQQQQPWAHTHRRTHTHIGCQWNRRIKLQGPFSWCPSHCSLPLTIQNSRTQRIHTLISLAIGANMRGLPQQYVKLANNTRVPLPTVFYIVEIYIFGYNKSQKPANGDLPINIAQVLHLHSLLIHMLYSPNISSNSPAAL